MADRFELFTSLRYDPHLEQVRDAMRNDCGWNSEKPSPFYMLDYHRDRMLRAASHWGWNKAVEIIEGSEGLARLESFMIAKLRKNDALPLRVKVLLSQEGIMGLEYSPVPLTPLANLFPQSLPIPNDDSTALGTSLGQLNLIPPYDVYLDTGFTHRSEFTHYKTTRREMYDSARQRADLKPTDAAKEVLIVNEATGSIMEGSLTTPYFWRGETWVTPPVSARFSNEAGSGGQDGTTRRWALERGLATEEDVKVSEVVDGEAVWLSNGVRGFVFGRIRRVRC